MALRKNRRVEVVVPEIIEDDETDEQQIAEKIHAPIIWATLPGDYEIQDLKPQQFEAVLDMIKNFHAVDDLLCRNVSIKDDPESMGSLSQQSSLILNDKLSVGVIEKGTNRVVAAALLRAVHKEDFSVTFSKTKLRIGEAYQKVMDLIVHMNRRADTFERLTCVSFLRMYVFVIHPDFKHRGFELPVFKALEQIARSVKLEATMAIVPDAHTQSLLKSIGMQMIGEQYYTSWLNKGGMVFEEPGPGNYSIAVMAAKIHNNQ